MLEAFMPVLYGPECCIWPDKDMIADGGSDFAARMLTFHDVYDHHQRHDINREAERDRKRKRER